MLNRKKELFLAAVIYLISVTVLFIAVYRFLENWNLNESNFIIIGVLILLVALGWGYVLTALIFAPKKQMEDTLTTLTNDIVHELNIPLSTIKANSAMLKKSCIDDDKSLKRLQRIEDASNRLKKLYDELVYTLRKEMHEIEKEHFDVKDIVKERVAIFKEQQRNPFLLELQSHEMIADKIGFEQMLDNLLSNAMKYSPKTSVISVVLKNNRLSIEDKGKGMSTSELLRVYERYFQGNEKSEGVGLGLTLVKAYCDSENISIQIDSQKEVGTRIDLDFH
jgi:signal transduction histidine kinase